MMSTTSTLLTRASHAAASTRRSGQAKRQAPAAALAHAALCGPRLPDRGRGDRARECGGRRRRLGDPCGSGARRWLDRHAGRHQRYGHAFAVAAATARLKLSSASTGLGAPGGSCHSSCRLPSLPWLAHSPPPPPPLQLAPLPLPLPPPLPLALPPPDKRPMVAPEGRLFATSTSYPPVSMNSGGERGGRRGRCAPLRAGRPPADSAMHPHAASDRPAPPASRGVEGALSLGRAAFQKSAATKARPCRLDITRLRSTTANATFWCSRSKKRCVRPNSSTMRGLPSFAA
jgi:hypothetical protein